MSHPYTAIPLVDAPGTVAIPVTWAEPCDEQNPAQTWARFWRVLESLTDAADVRLRVAGGGGLAPTASILVGGPSEARALSFARVVRLAAEACITWLRFGEPTSSYEPAADGPVCTLCSTIETSRVAPSYFVTPWVAATQSDKRVTLDLAFVKVRGDGEGRDEALMTVEVRGQPAEAGLVAALMGVAAGDDVRLFPVYGKAATELQVPLIVAGRLACAPFNQVSLWQERPQRSDVSISDLLDDFPPRTVIVFGGPRLSRSHFAVHRARKSIQSARRLALVTTDMTLAAAVASELASDDEGGFDTIMVDNDCRAPFGICEGGIDEVEAGEHAEDLVSLIEASTPSVGMAPAIRRLIRILFTGLSSLDEPMLLADLEELLSGPRSSRWQELFDRHPNKKLHHLHEFHDASRADPLLARQVLDWLDIFADARVCRAVSAATPDTTLRRLLGRRSLVVAIENLGERGSAAVLALTLLRLLRAAERGRVPLDLIVDEVRDLPELLIQRLLGYSERSESRLTLLSQSPSALEPSVLSAMVSGSGAVAAARLSATDARMLDSMYPTLNVASIAQRLGVDEWVVSSGAKDAVGRLEPVAVGADRTLLRLSSLLTLPAECHGQAAS